MIRPLIVRLGVGVGLLATLSACATSRPSAREPGLIPQVPAATTFVPRPTDSVIPKQTPEVLVFTVDGAGPYLIGSEFHQLKEKGQLAQSTTKNSACGNHLDARGTAPWQDIRVAARNGEGRLYLVINESADIPTPHGATLGMTVLQLKAIYGASGEELTHDGANAYLVKTSTANGVLFTFQSDKVDCMMAGNSGYLRESFMAGSGYC